MHTAFNFRQQSEVTLKKPIKINSQEEFKEVFENYFNPLVNFINQYVQNIENSREIVQNTFLKLWDKKDVLTIETSLKNYLYRSAKNAMIDYIRKHEKVKLISDEKEQLIYNLPDTDDSYLSPYIIRNEILKAMEELKPKNKEIFRLSKFEGLTYEEIAKHLNISKRSVEDNVARATIKLKEILLRTSQIFD